MNTPVILPESFDPALLNIQPADLTSQKFLMLIEGTAGLGPKKAAEKHGYSEQRYFQLIRAFNSRGFDALVNKKVGPKKPSVRTDAVENLIIRHLFLDRAQSEEAIAQKLRQEGHKISAASVRRTISEYGLHKKNSTPCLLPPNKANKWNARQPDAKRKKLK